MSVKPKRGVDTAGLMAGILGTGFNEQEQRKAPLNPPSPITEPAKKTAIPYGIPTSQPGRPRIGRETKTMRLLPETIEKLETEANRWMTDLGLKESDCTIGRAVEVLTAEALLGREKIHQVKTALKKTEWIDDLCPLCRESKSNGHRNTCVFTLFRS